MKNQSEIIFQRDKIFTRIKELGFGGTGEAYLVEEKETEMFFAIKKYVPYGSNKDKYIENYNRFVDEMKILFKISHPNIVRIYNYFLYPEKKTGYLQMEYIDGVSIDKYYSETRDENWERIFLEALSAFEYLEKIGILHRDIRASNIMIDKESRVKIIDFGFGKKLEKDKTNLNSIFLNWPVTEQPQEVKSGEYNHSSEVYYLGHLFKKILGNEVEEFAYLHVIEKMCEVETKKRYTSFKDISLHLSEDLIEIIDFTEDEREIYLEFANKLDSIINYYTSEIEFVETSKEVLEKLENLLKTSVLEEFLQNNELLISSFVSSSYNYTKKNCIKIDTILNFYNMVKDLPQSKQKIVIDNIHTRLANIEIDAFGDSLPF